MWHVSESILNVTLQASSLDKGFLVHFDKPWLTSINFDKPKMFTVQSYSQSAFIDILSWDPIRPAS